MKQFFLVTAVACLSTISCQIIACPADDNIKKNNQCEKISSQENHTIKKEHVS